MSNFDDREFLRTYYSLASDVDFIDALAEDPYEAFENQGVELPEDYTINVVVADPEVMYILVPHADIPEEELLYELPEVAYLEDYYRFILAHIKRGDEIGKRCLEDIYTVFPELDLGVEIYQNTEKECFLFLLKQDEEMSEEELEATAGAGLAELQHNLASPVHGLHVPLPPPCIGV